MNLDYSEEYGKVGMAAIGKVQSVLAFWRYVDYCRKVKTVQLFWLALVV